MPEDKEHNCRTCKLNGGAAPFSGHHIQCLSARGSNGIAIAMKVQATAAQVRLQKEDVGSLQVYQDDDVDKKHAVEISMHGINSGWALWPMNFDPIWIEKCGLYQPIDDDDERKTDNGTN